MSSDVIRTLKWVFGKGGLIEEYKRQEQMLEETPKSVASMTRIFAPQISRDFPGMNLEQFEADEREMTKYIIGTISDLDTPLTPSMKGRRSLGAYFSGITDEDVQRERDEILRAQPEQIRALAPLMRAVLGQENLCVIGNEQKIKEDADLFYSTRSLV